MSKRRKDAEPIPPAETTPRRRVMDLVRRMARVTAVGGAAAGLSACESHGPIVCDPLPPPITCSNPTRAELQNAMYTQASWVAGDGGALEVALVVTYVGRQSVTFAPTVSVTGATQKQLVVSPTSLAVNLAPGAGVTTATVNLTFGCEGTDDAMTLTLDLRGTPRAGNPVTVAITTP